MARYYAMNNEICASARECKQRMQASAQEVEPRIRSKIDAAADLVPRVSEIVVRAKTLNLPPEF